MSPGGARWVALTTTLVLALALLFVLPRFAADVVRSAIEAESAADRAAFAAGESPWSWELREPDDVVAGRTFGSGTLDAGKDGLVFASTDDGSAMEVGLPLARQADLVRLDTLRMRATASVDGEYGLLLRETLDEPLRRASLGKLASAELDRPIRLDTLPWIDAAGRPVRPPTRAAMLRIVASLPAGATFTIDHASLDPAHGVVTPPIGALPSRLSAEGLLAWRDSQRAADPLVTFGTLPPATAQPEWRAWILPIGYLLVLATAGLRLLSRARQPSPADDLLNAVLALAGPLWFIAGMELSSRPAPPGVVMFSAGVVYALFLNGRRLLPAWNWLGAWRAAGWPLLAIPIAAGVVAFGGHAPVWPPLGRALIYVGWALFQQWLLLAVFGALLARVMPRAAAVLLTALAFALLHTPNGLLMQLCFVAELGWAWWYVHRRALLPVAVAHAASAVLLQAGLAGGLLRSLEVSARFLN
jgi:hypothetical protein